VDREKKNERYHRWYHERGGKQLVAERNKRQEVIEYRRLQSRLYKARHPEKVAEFNNQYRNRRNKRIAEQSDGTAGAMVAKLLKLRHCQYCGHRFTSDMDKRIDHRDPVAFGGQHSAANLEVCCDGCNSKKAAMSFAEWIAILAEPYRSKAIGRAEKAMGASIYQPSLPLFGGAVIRRPIEKTVNAYAAKRDALAAWRKWLYEMAPDQWLDGYYANHPKPWLDHRLSKSDQFLVHYKEDPAFARRWNDRRNARRIRQRAERANTNNGFGSLAKAHRAGRKPRVTGLV
jgi:5-methylcytosine-specific restriction endonuclease McrA